MDDKLQPKAVIIIGGSLAGLMHALVFLSLPSPPEIRILERSPTKLLHNQGAGIVAGQEVQDFFARYVNPGREVAITSALRHYLNLAGEVISDSVDHRQQRMTSWDLLYHLLRWRVEGLQTEYVPAQAPSTGEAKASYENDCTVTDITHLPNQEGIQVTYNHANFCQHTATADLVLAADGGSSKIRDILLPDIKRTYAGYVAWRGTVPETQLSPSAREAFIEKFTFFHGEGIQVLGYLIPGVNGTMEPGERLFNWVWYCNYVQGSPELEELMTDIRGRRHAVTLPVDSIQPQVWERQKDYSKKVLPPQFAEAVEKTEHPFVQAVTDVISPRNSFFEGKVLLVGDALAGFRPHTAFSSGQAAFDALQMGKLLRHEITRDDYNSSVMELAERMQKAGVAMGERSQFGRHPYAS